MSRDTLNMSHDMLYLLAFVAKYCKGQLLLMNSCLLSNKNLFLVLLMTNNTKRWADSTDRINSI